MKLTQFQLKEFSKYWFDLSKLALVSFILKFFEPGAPKFDINFAVTVTIGLTLAIGFAILGLKLAKEIKR